jgi:hypothetical protein
MAKNTIKIKKYSDVVEEMKANAAITPGMLVEEMSTGNVRAHATPSGNAIPMFALEDELQGKTIDDAYAQNDQVQVWIPGRGDMVYGLLAKGQNVTRGTFLVSNGDGYLAAVSDSASFGDDDSAKVIGVALESVNATAAAARIIVRII